jgi:hypothetical protein
MRSSNPSLGLSASIKIGIFFLTACTEKYKILFNFLSDEVLLSHAQPPLAVENKLKDMNWISLAYISITTKRKKT